MNNQSSINILIRHQLVNHFFRLNGDQVNPKGHQHYRRDPCSNDSKWCISESVQKIFIAISLKIYNISHRKKGEP